MMKNELTLSLLDYLTKLRDKKVFVCGIGGGGDILATIPTVNFLKSLGIRTLVGAVVWERFVVDPVPGPISLREMHNIKKINNVVASVNSETYALRGSKKIVPQIAKVSKALKENLYAIDISGGVRTVINGLQDFLESQGIELIIGIDGGGDVLAVGGEEDLWSPVSDQVMLSVLANLMTNSIIGVFGLGTDGELSLRYILNRLSYITRHGGYLGLIGISKKDIKLMDELMGTVVTETNIASLKAAKGEIGKIKIRNGSRTVDLSLGILIAVTVFLDSKILYSQSKMAKAIKDTVSIWEAWKILNSMGIFTELDLEYGVLEYLKRGNRPNLLEIRKLWMRNQKRFIKYSPVYGYTS